MNRKWDKPFSCNRVAKFNNEAGERSRTLIRARNAEIAGNDFVFMAGPCAVESEEQLLCSRRKPLAKGAHPSCGNPVFLSSGGNFAREIRDRAD